MSEGRAATVVVGLAVTVVLTAGGLPPVLRQRGVLDALTALPPPLASATGSESAAPAAPPPDPDGAAPVPLPAAPVPVGASGRLAPPVVATEDEPVAERDEFFRTPALGSVVEFGSVAPGVADGIAVHEDGTVYVATSATDGARIVSFSADGTPGRTYRLGTTSVTGLALDADGGLLVLDHPGSRVLRVDIDSGQERELVAIPNVTTCLPVLGSGPCERGAVDHAPSLQGLVIDDGVVYVTDRGQATIWRLGDDGVQPWFQDVARGLTGIALDAAGDVLVAAAETLDVRAGVGGALYRIRVEDDGSAGASALVTPFGRGDEPAGLVARPDGVVVVALRGSSAVVLLDASGTEFRRIGGPDGAEALDGPTGVAFQRSTLLVTNRSGAVLAVGVEP